jgi:hypothetical protein
VIDTVTTSTEPADPGQTLSPPTEPPGAAADGAAPWLAVTGFDGPLDLLLALARAQQIDLARLSIAALIGTFADGGARRPCRHGGSRGAAPTVGRPGLQLLRFLSNELQVAIVCAGARCGPTVFPRWPNPRPPGSRTRSFHTCQGLRPRRVGRVLAMAPPLMLPSRVFNHVGTRD